MKILHCSGLPTSAVQANKAQKRQMSIMRDKGEGNQRHKKVRARQSLGDRPSLTVCTAVASVLSWRQDNKKWVDFASMQSFHPSPVTPDHTGAADPSLTQRKRSPDLCRCWEERYLFRQQEDKPPSLKYSTIHCSLCLPHGGGCLKEKNAEQTIRIYQ